MPTIDDLTISLTIKDNSNLDKLRKNLDTVIKSGGLQPGGVAGAGFGAESKVSKKILDKLDYLQQYILPISVGTRQEDITIAGGKLLKIIEDFDLKEQLKELWKGGTGAGIAGFMKKFDITKEEIPAILDELFDQITGTIHQAMAGEMPVGKAWKTITLMIESLSKLEAGEFNVGRMKDILNDLMNISNEYHGEAIEYLRKLVGANKVIDKLNIADLKKDVYDFEEVKDKLKEEWEKFPEDVRKKIDELVTEIPGLPQLEKIFTGLGFKEFTRDLFSKEFIANNQELQALSVKWLDMILKKGFDPEGEPGSAIAGFRSFLNDMFQSTFGENIFQSPKQIDALVTAFSKIAEELGFKKTGEELVGIDFKKWAKDLGKERHTYFPMLKSAIRVLGEGKEGAFPVGDPRVEYKRLGLADLLSKIGKDPILSEEKLEELLETAQEKKTTDIDKHLAVIEEKMATADGLEEIKELYKKIDLLREKIEKMYSEF